MRGPLFEKRRGLMAQWASYVAGGAAKVVQMIAR